MRNARYRILFSVAIAVFMVAVVYFTVGICFETNDDRVIAGILSGTMVGEPDAHTVYVNYILSLLFTLLYRVTTAIPWWGLFLIAVHLCAWFLILYHLLYICRNKKQTAVAVAVVMGLYILNLYSIGCLQYTSTAALLAISGYVCLLLNGQKRKGLFLFAVTSLIAGLIRQNAMLMIQPMGMAMYAGFVFIKKELISLRQRIVLILQAVLVVFGVYVCGNVGNFAGYGGEDWKKFEAFSEARTELFDYYMPSYEEVKGILDKYGVSKEEYHGFQGYAILDWTISSECAAELAEYAKMRMEDRTLAQMWQEFRRLMIGSDVLYRINQVVFGVMIAVFFCLLFWKQYHMLIPWGCLQGGKILVWWYLVYNGRTPQRVILPIYLCEIILLFILLVYVVSKGRIEKKRTVVCAWGMCFVFFCGVLISGEKQYTHVKEVNRVQTYLSGNLLTLHNYLNKNEENKYVVNLMSVSEHYRGRALDTDIFTAANYVLSGGWYANSPVMSRVIKEYLKDDGRGVHLVVYDNGMGIDHVMVKFFRVKTQSEPVLADRVEVLGEGAYNIWYFKGDFQFVE